MRVRAKLSLRNEHMLAAREALGLTQAAVAAAAGMATTSYVKLERFDFSGAGVEQRAAAVAGFLGLPIEQVMPEALLGRVLESDRTVIAECPQLAELAGHCARLLPAPLDSMELQERTAKLRRGLLQLTHKQRQVLILRYGLYDEAPQTGPAMGRVIGISPARVLRLEYTALRKLRADQALQDYDTPPAAERAAAAAVVPEPPADDAVKPVRRRCRPLPAPPADAV